MAKKFLWTVLLSTGIFTLANVADVSAYTRPYNWTREQAREALRPGNTSMTMRGKPEEDEDMRAECQWIASQIDKKCVASQYNALAGYTIQCRCW